ncbi:peptidyl-prolyl cis-trans isomerase-like 4 [Histomonas meleagridis]|uniref:peptidyl-prolyl cis-trans isomerase-like 4 n=1 Tax=Histomonas meleagridis TaxID=135588 RepID=UPI0035599CCD|nr:peptidyl-prolyl cis-trans isomerase-like 4 [Histomonas meleagridis]KAH0803474.1 peptidyl-prolyl cis-trans isomerase-like 4 [Histomonas meleagridis]
MSVAFVTTRGTFVVDLYLRSAPMLGFNFLKLCKIGWYKNSIFSQIIENFFIKLEQLPCKGGTTIYSLMTGENAYIPDEISKKLTHSKAGILSTCNEGANKNTSDFFITLGSNLSRFDDKRSIFGEVSENFELIQGIAREAVDKENRPIRNIRILETRVLYDPFPDPPDLSSLNFQPYERIKERDRLEDDEVIRDMSESQFQEEMSKIQARQNAQILELLGDIPDADQKPPDTSLFVCKLSPITTEDGLKIVFSRFGEVKRVDLIRDKVTGESLCYGFVDFEKASDAENAFLKMRRAIIDNRQVLVDFSQSLRGPKREN